MEKVEKKPVSGLSRTGLRIWGLLFVLAGLVGRAIIGNELLGLQQISGAELLEMMQGSDNVMILATVTLILQALETCAVPIFAFLLVDGFERTASFGKYLLRVVIVAVVSEVPFNLAFSGKVIDGSSRNPVVALALGLVMLYLFRYFGEDNIRQKLIKLLVGVAGILWAVMLRVDNGIGLMLMICVLRAFRRNSMVRNIAGATGAVVCTLFSPFYLASPMAMLIVHFYNEEKEFSKNKWVPCLTYPVLLVIVWLVAKFAF